MNNEATTTETNTEVGGLVEPLVMPDIGTVTGQQVKEAMIANDITYVDHHECGICGVMVHYFRDGEFLYFDPRCGCGCGGMPQEREFEDAARWINMQDKPEIKAKLARRFGIEA
jgi:hypothetical protein